jgi:hypothetical protein
VLGHLSAWCSVRDLACLASTAGQDLYRRVYALQAKRHQQVLLRFPGWTAILDRPKMVCRGRSVMGSVGARAELAELIGLQHCRAYSMPVMLRLIPWMQLVQDLRLPPPSDADLVRATAPLCDMDACSIWLQFCVMHPFRPPLSAPPTPVLLVALLFSFNWSGGMCAQMAHELLRPDALIAMYRASGWDTCRFVIERLGTALDHATACELLDGLLRALVTRAFYPQTAGDYQLAIVVARCVECLRKACDLPSLQWYTLVSRQAVCYSLILLALASPDLPLAALSTLLVLPTDDDDASTQG